MLYSFLYVSRRCLPLDGGDLDIHIVSSVKEVKHNIQVQWNMHHLINFVVGRWVVKQDFVDFLVLDCRKIPSVLGCHM